MTEFMNKNYKPERNNSDKRRFYVRNYGANQVDEEFHGVYYLVILVVSTDCYAILSVISYQ